MISLISLERKKGITLVETLIAMVITAIMLVGFLQACTASAYMLKNIKYRLRAVNIAQDEIESVKAGGFAAVVVGDQAWLNVLIDEGPTAAPGDDIIGQMRRRIRNVAGGPTNGVTITIEVAWNMLGQARQETVETVFYDRR